MRLFKFVIKDIAETLGVVWILFSLVAAFGIEGFCKQVGVTTGLSLFVGNYLLLFIALSIMKHVKGPHE